MLRARRAAKRSAAFDSDDDEPGVDNSCSVNSGDEAAREAGSAAAMPANRDVTVSEENDSDTEAKGELALDTLDFGCYTLVFTARRCRCSVAGE